MFPAESIVYGVLMVLGHVAAYMADKHMASVNHRARRNKGCKCRQKGEFIFFLGILAFQDFMSRLALGSTLLINDLFPKLELE